VSPPSEPARSASPPPRHRPADRVGAAALTLAAAVAGGLPTYPRSRWFARLRKPAWYPPPAAFGIVWTALYTGIAWAGGEVLSRGDAAQRNGFRRAYAANLALNTAWTPLFFRAHRLWPAAAESAVLTASTVDLVRRAAPVSRPAAAALVPYAVWTAFATALSVAIARRN
jgi:tryptophan-rich sensory protein